MILNEIFAFFLTILRHCCNSRWLQKDEHGQEANNLELYFQTSFSDILVRGVILSAAEIKTIKSFTKDIAIYYELFVLITFIDIYVGYMILC